ncbi:Hypothetical predicted protein [Mytilus galloprovincialis]|uniref:DUF6589 domain-containing protein n=1 Tax=Mytilus galloprovincialis TaxID=29158 RepID=A0A8B6CRG8_MYTGA|nr:Hypothetical predicted protein [Mytilus galloprovincialis]
MDLLQTICGEKKKNEPRLVTSMAVLLFTRNQQMNTDQSINSVLMFRGHVRTKVYTTFNRAGLSSSYKSTLNTIDKLCEKFDEPVKRWTEQLSSETIDQNTSLGDHTYSATSDESNVENIATDDNILHIQSPPVMYIAEPITDTCTTSDFTSLDTCQETVPTTDSPMEKQYDFVDNGTSVPPGTPLCSIENHTSYYTPMQPSVPCEEDSPYTTKSSAAIQETGSFQIIMDNLNMNQKTRHKTEDTSNKVHNLVHSMAVNDRATPTDPLDEIHPQADILSLSNELFIPSDNDIHHLNEDFKILIQRALVDNIPGLSEYRQVVQYHILHEFSQQAEKKSTVIPLGILEKDENITEQMIDVITHLQQYVPKRDKKLKPLLLGGDALSVERGEAAQKARIDAVTCEDRLDGFIWKSEDWHGHVISLQDTFNLHFKGSSSGEMGTLFQLKNKFDRRGVKSEVKDAVNDCREFLRFVTRGYIILGAMHLLGFDSLDKFKDLNHTSDTQKKEFLEKLSQDIVDKYIATEKFDLEAFKQTNTQEEGRHMCGYPGCKKSFAVDGKCRSKHRFRCPYKEFEGVIQPDNENDQQVQSTIEVEKDKKEDFKRNYSCSLLRDGLFDWCREDAARENDGERLVRMWRFDILKFALNNHVKYRLLAFKLHAQLLAILPPKQAFQLKNNRTVNIHGGKGANVPGDLALEFMNMRAKDALNSLRGNMTSASIERCGRSLQGCNDIIDSYTTGLNQFFGKPSNTKPSIQKDIDILVKHLQPEELFQDIPGRCHRTFDSMNSNCLTKLDGQKLNSWLTSKKEEFSKTQRLRSYLV